MRDVDNVAERMAAIPESERVKAKRAAREECLDRVTLGKEQGREIGRIARDLYRKEQHAAQAIGKPTQRSRRRYYKQWPGPRPADTYRVVRRTMERGKRMAPLLKAWRQRTGESRAAFDRRRQALVRAGEA